MSIVQLGPATVASPDSLHRTLVLTAAARIERAQGSHMFCAMSGLAA